MHAFIKMKNNPTKLRNTLSVKQFGCRSGERNQQTTIQQYTKSGERDGGGLDQSAQVMKNIIPLSLNTFANRADQDQTAQGLLSVCLLKYGILHQWNWQVITLFYVAI